MLQLLGSAGFPNILFGVNQ